MSAPMLPEQMRALRAVANAPAEGESALLRGYLKTVLEEAEQLQAALDQSENELTGARLSLWEEERDSARLRLALESARRGRRAARARIAEVETSAALATEYRVPIGSDATTWLWVRREPGGDRWAVLTSHRVDVSRKAWTGEMWMPVLFATPSELWAWESAEEAVAAAVAQVDAEGGAA